MDATLPELRQLLHQAAEHLRRDDGIYAGRYPTRSALADFIDDASERVCTGDRAPLGELWRIFKPKSDWDRCSGPQALANRIFDLLDEIKRCG